MRICIRIRRIVNRLHYRCIMSNVNSFATTAVLCLQTLSNCVVLTVGQYNYAFFLQTYPFPPNSTHNTTNNTLSSIYSLDDVRAQCTESKDSPTSAAQEWAQQRSADLFFWTNLYSSGPLIVMTYLLGLYTPQLGRRFVAILSMLGTGIQMAIWLFIIYFQLAEYWWYIAAVVVGLSGSSSLLGFVLNLVIIDSTMESERSSRFVLLGGIATALGAVATFGIGYYIEWRGFTDLFLFGLALQLISILIVIFFFKSENPHVVLDETTSLLSSNSVTSNEFNESITVNSCAHCFDVCTIFRVNRRSPQKSASLFLTLFSYVFYTLASAAFSPFLWYLLNAPFCWSSTDIGNYSAVTAITYAILSVIGMQVLTRAGANDTLICAISHLCFLAVCLWTAFARYSWELYVGLLISAFSGYQGLLTVSMMSKWLEMHEQSNAFVIVTEISTIVTAFGNSFFNWVYARTVTNYKNFTWLLAAGLCAIPFVLNICILIINRRIPEEQFRPLSEANTQPAPLRLAKNVPPRAGDVACLVMPSRSLVSSLRTSPIDRSRAYSQSSIDNDDDSPVPLPIPTTTDLVII